MTRQIDVSDVESKAYAAISQDGFTQMLIGLILVGLIVIYIPPGASFFGDLFSTVFFGVYCVAVSIILKFLQRRITHPRIGYVRTKLSKQDLMLVIVLIAVIVFVVFGVFCIEMNLRYHPVRIFSFLIPLSIGTLAYGLIYHDRAWAGLALVYLACGTFIFLIPIFSDFRAKMVLVTGCLGIITFITGVVRLRRFLTLFPPGVKEKADVT
ncbi:MAG: hypothetical protein JSW49_04900 [candidate division WOR-3 bacterium]|nr:MAG: hypothetical protein JSW49_04900 [candidate division WOR-3 bacterium]